ncbi:MAG: hypothetical protein ACI9QQ_001001 [Myxococcota bacterium]
MLKELRVPAQGIYKKSRKPPGETYEA